MQATSGLKELTATEIQSVSGAFAYVPGPLLNAAAGAANSGVCDYHWQSGQTYCYNDLLGPDFAVFIN